MTFDRTPIRWWWLSFDDRYAEPINATLGVVIVDAIDRTEAWDRADQLGLPPPQHRSNTGLDRGLSLVEADGLLRYLDPYIFHGRDAAVDALARCGFEHDGFLHPTLTVEEELHRLTVEE